MKIISVDYQSLMVVILVSTFELLLVALVKHTTIFYNCPCSVHPGFNPPSFVSNNYYCESAAVGYLDFPTYYFDDTLWDKAGCIEGSSRCDNTQPWFCRELNYPTQDNIEARICSHGFFQL